MIYHEWRVMASSTAGGLLYFSEWKLATLSTERTACPRRRRTRSFNLLSLDGGDEKTEQNTVDALWRKITANNFLPGFYVSPKMADTCGQVLLGSGLTVLSHPLMYIKVLIQVRHAGLSRPPGSRGWFALLRHNVSVTRFKVQYSGPRVNAAQTNEKRFPRQTPSECRPVGAFL